MSNIHDQANNADSMPLPHVSHVHNTQPQAPTINSSVSSLSYEELQLGNSDLWNDHTNLISLFDQIFNNINIVSKPHIIKVFPQSDMAIV